MVTVSNGRFALSLLSLNYAEFNFKLARISSDDTLINMIHMIFLIFLPEIFLKIFEICIDK